MNTGLSEGIDWQESTYLCSRARSCRFTWMTSTVIQ